MHTHTHLHAAPVALCCLFDLLVIHRRDCNSLQTLVIPRRLNTLKSTHNIGTTTQLSSGRMKIDGGGVNANLHVSKPL